MTSTGTSRVGPVVKDDPNRVTVGAFDRGTPAGRLLHNLYTKPEKPSTVDAELIEKYRALRQRKDDLLLQRPKPIPKSRAYVEYPTESFEKERQLMPFALPRPGRRGEKEIRQVAEAEPPSKPPEPKKPAVTEATKAKLQRFMEYNGNPPELEAPRPRRTASQPISHGRLRSPREELVEMFNSVAKEIQERRDFLNNLPPGKEESYGHIKLEISDRVKELKRIDALIKQEEENE